MARSKEGVWGAVRLVEQRLQEAVVEWAYGPKDRFDLVSFAHIRKAADVSPLEWTVMERTVTQLAPALLESWHDANNNNALRRVCVCLQPASRAKPTLQCEQCCQQFHPACIGLQRAPRFLVCPGCHAIPEEPVGSVEGVRISNVVTVTELSPDGASYTTRDVPVPTGSNLANLALFRVPEGHTAWSAERISRGIRARVSIPRGPFWASMPASSRHRQADSDTILLFLPKIPTARALTRRAKVTLRASSITATIPTAVQSFREESSSNSLQTATLPLARRFFSIMAISLELNTPFNKLCT